MSNSLFLKCELQLLKGSGRGRHTHAEHWVQRQVSAAACGWQSTDKSRLSHPADHS